MQCLTPYYKYMNEDNDITDAVGELIRRQKAQATSKGKTKVLKWVIIILVVALVLLFAKEVLA